MQGVQAVYETILKGPICPMGAYTLHLHILDSQEQFANVSEITARHSCLTASYVWSSRKWSTGH